MSFDFLNDIYSLRLNRIESQESIFHICWSQELMILNISFNCSCKLVVETLESLWIKQLHGYCISLWLSCFQVINVEVVGVFEPISILKKTISSIFHWVSHLKEYVLIFILFVAILNFNIIIIYFDSEIIMNLVWKTVVCYFDIEGSVIVWIISFVIFLVSSFCVTNWFDWNLVADFLISVLKPIHVFLNNIICSLTCMRHPHLVVVAPVSNFCFSCCYAKLTCNPITGISSCYDTNILNTWTDVLTFREFWFLSNFFKNTWDFWIFFRKHIWEFSIERNKPHLSSTMEIINEFKFIFFRSKPIPKYSSFRFRKGLRTSISLITLIINIVSLSKTKAPISIQINALSTLFTFWIFTNFM